MNIQNREPIVHARGLTKQFGKHVAVKAIDFDIWPGEVVGFLGPNGAGKTTTIRMLLNILKPNAGDLRIFGMNYIHQRTKILESLNASFGTLTLLGKLSVYENLQVFADLYGISKPNTVIDEMIEWFQLKELSKQSLFTLSTGQQVRVAMAKSFINKPKLLLLDEPTASLDPDVADRVRSLVTDSARAHNTTVFITSHNMLEVERMCSRVLFINQGRIEAEGTPQELARRVKQWTLRLTTNKENRTVELDRNEVGQYLTDLVQSGHTIKTIEIHEPTLEDFFVHSARQGEDN